MEIIRWVKGNAPYIVNSFEMESHYFYPLHSHENHWELVYCEQGSFKHVINGTSYIHNEGELILIRPSVIHSLKGRGFKFHNIAFSGDWFNSLKLFMGEELTNELSEASDSPTFFSIPRGERMGFTDRIGKLLISTDESHAHLYLTHFVIMLLDQYLLKRGGIEGAQFYPPWLRDVLEKIEQWDDGKPLTMEILLNWSCRCSEHVSRTFKKHLGLTPSQYLRNKRLKRAAELLRNTNYSVKQIGYLLFYENSNYFHRQFKEQFGQTPKEYRREHSQFIL